MCENHELSTILAFFCTEFALRTAPGMFRSGRGCPGGAFRGGVRPRRVLRDVPGRPLGRKCQYPGGFLRVFARREGRMCENHELSTILPFGRGDAMGEGRVWWWWGKTHILLQNVRFVEARRDFENPGIPGALFISFYPMIILLSELRSAS